MATTVTPTQEGTSQFLSAVQFSIQEPSPQLTERSQQLIRRHFAETVVVVPEMKEQTVDARVQGNELVFYMVSENDPQVAMQEMLSLLLERLNGQVRARGRLSQFRAGLSQPRGAYLETVVNDQHDAVESLKARSVPMHDLFKQLGTQIKNLSYVLPGDCADYPVTWSFKREESGPRPVNLVIEELASRHKLRLDRRGGTHILSGTCATSPDTTSEQPARTQAFVPEALEPEASPDGLVAVGFASTGRQQVFVPLSPVGD